jgi:hypothetical protein
MEHLDDEIARLARGKNVYRLRLRLPDHAEEDGGTLTTARAYAAGDLVNVNVGPDAESAERTGFIWRVVAAEDNGKVLVLDYVGPYRDPTMEHRVDERTLARLAHGKNVYRLRLRLPDHAEQDGGTFITSRAYASGDLVNVNVGPDGVSREGTGFIWRVIAAEDGGNVLVLEYMWPHRDQTYP